MLKAYDLTREPWIPVVTNDGQSTDVSLRTLFSDAHNIRRLSCEIPTQDFAILRLLLAILHRATNGPQDSDAWAKLWNSTELPTAAIEQYLDKHAHRFDLLHPAEPFYQVATLQPAKTTADDEDDVTGLGKFATGSMRRLAGIDSISFADAARCLIHTHAFNTSGVKTPMAGTRHTVKDGKVFPLGAAWAATTGPIYLTGNNLRETLLLNLIPNDQCEYDTTADLPVWEKPHPDVTHTTTPLTGKVDIYTLQERRVRLIHDENAVTGALITYGDVRDATDHHKHDPLTAWQQTSRKGIRPVTHWRESDHWRGLTSMLSHGDSITPGVLNHIAIQIEDGYLPDTFLARTVTVGLKFNSSRSKVQSAVHDTFDLPARILHDPERVALVLEAATAADAAASAYADASLHLAKAAGDRPNPRKEHESGPYVEGRALAITALRRDFMTWLRTVDTPDEQPITPAYVSTIRDLWSAATSHAPALVIAGRQITDEKGARKTFNEARATRDLNFALTNLTSESNDDGNH